MKRIFVVLAGAVLALSLTGCPAAQRKQVAQAAQDASIIVKGFQQGEIAAYQQGTIPEADHMFIQKELVAVGTVGKTLDECIRVTTSNAGIVTCANSATSAVDQINTDGGLYLKSEQAKTTFQLTMTGVRTSLAVIATIFGG